MRKIGTFGVLVAVALVVALLPVATAAQRGRSGHGPSTRSVVYVSSYYGPFFPFYGWYPWYPYAGYPPYGLYGVEPTGGLRLQVSPRDTEVFVDGYYAGIVDDFDGFFQRLHLQPGAHEILLYHAKYRSIRQTLYVAAGTDYKIRHELTPLKAGEPSEPRPVPATPPAGPPESAPLLDPSAPVGLFGTLSIRVQPSDATILIDGDEWRGSEGAGALIVQLSEGAHRVEIRKDGRVTFTSPVTVRRGETTNLNVALPTEGGR